MNRTAFLALAFTTMASTAWAAGEGDAVARHRQEVAVCTSGQSNQDRATCLREAGAALVEARRGGLDGNASSYEKNQLRRCEPLPAEERSACEARMRGQGTTSGSVAGGGIYRELVTRETEAPVMPPAAPPADAAR